MELVIIDLEFNQAFDFDTGRKMKKHNHCPFEVIQMGACVLGSNNEIKGTFSSFVKPQFYHRMHPFVKDMTGITEKMLKNAPSFRSVLNDFRAFCASSTDEYVCGCWGDSDMPQLFRNMYVHQLPFDMVSKQYINIQREMSVFLQKSTNYHMGLVNATEACDIETDDDFHDALSDACYTALVYNHIQEKSEQEPLIRTFNPQKLIRKDKRKISLQAKKDILKDKALGKQNQAPEKQALEKQDLEKESLEIETPEIETLEKRIS